MTDAPLAAIIARIESTYGAWTRETSLQQMRRDFDALYPDADVPVVVRDFDIDGLPARWVAAAHARADKVVLYLHGGGFRMGSAESHRALIARLSHESGCSVLALNYRTVPEHRYPAQLDDAERAYAWLLASGHQAGDIAVVGDSAGAGLAASLLLRLKDRGALRLPGAGALLSPWLDMTARAESYQSRAEHDPIHSRKMILALARAYLGQDVDPTDPLVSPIFGDLHGLPPILIQVGDHEVGLGDATDFADSARNAGVDVTLDIWPNMIHVFQQFAPDLIEGRQAIAQLGLFLARHLRA